MSSSRAVQISFRRMQYIFHMATLLHLTHHLWPEPEQLPEEAVYDYIIVGGGTAGCVIASRLVSLKNVNVLLIEAGGNPPLESSYPQYYAYMKQSLVDWNMTSEREQSMRYHKHGVAEITQGKMLGGTSGLNHMVYARGNPVDYESWAKITNDSSWSYDAILPLFKKSEKIIDDEILDSLYDKDLHGTKGRMKVRKIYDDSIEKYMKAFEEIGNKIVVDINSLNPLGVTNALLTCSRKWRQSTAYAFLKAVKDNRRLHVMTNTLVTEILFDESDTAIGVKIRTIDDDIVRVKATREVILTAGVFKTPQLLMLSGIGPKNHLESKNIRVRMNLPVGQNLQDLPTVITIFSMGISFSTTFRLQMNSVKRLPLLYASVALDPRKKVPNYVVHSTVFDNSKRFFEFCAITLSFENDLCDKLFKKTQGRHMFVAMNYLLYPKSRGVVLLRSGNIKDQPLIKLGLYKNESDIESHAAYLQHFSPILNTSFFTSNDADFVDPKFRHCRNEKWDSLKYWRCYASSMVSTSQSNVGTCAIGNVVDSDLFVKGVRRLRVADASVIPNAISSPAATVIMIAEKVSKMIKKAHKKKPE